MLLSFVAFCSRISVNILWNIFVLSARVREHFNMATVILIKVNLLHEVRQQLKECLWCHDLDLISIQTYFRKSLMETVLDKKDNTTDFFQRLASVFFPSFFGNYWEICCLWKIFMVFYGVR